MGCVGVSTWAGLHGQNYVPNPDFEQHDDCSGGVTYSILSDWSVPMGCIESTYFNACAPPPNDIYLGVPLNINGYEPAHSGVGYITSKPFTTVSSNYRNYVAVTLSSNLPAGEHCVRFWMSLCDSSSFKTNTFHALLTFGFPAVYDDQDSTWAEDAQVTFNTSEVDGNGWYLMQGSFTSTETLRRLTLGSFLKGQALLDDTTFLGYHYMLPSFFAGYYIDDVYVGPCDVAIPETRHRAALELFPNPATDVIRVSLGDAQVDYLEVLNTVGAVVLHQPAGSSSMNLDVSGLVPGPYMVRAIVDGRPIATRSFVRIED